MSFFFGVVVTLAGLGLWKLVFDKGHCLYGVTDRISQEILRDVLKEFTRLRFRHPIDSGGTHQAVFSGGTVFAYFDREIPEDLPRNARSYAVRGINRRQLVVSSLVSRLRSAGYDAQVHEPLQHLPRGTFLMVTSNAFIGHAHAFRPHWIRMAWLDWQAKRRSR